MAKGRARASPGIFLFELVLCISLPRWPWQHPPLMDHLMEWAWQIQQAIPAAVGVDGVVQLWPALYRYRRLDIGKKEEDEAEEIHYVHTANRGL